MVQEEQSSDWIAYIIHVLAINYGWSPNTILEEVRFSEAIQYATMIRNQRIDHYLTLLSIAHNPQAKYPNTLFRILNSQRSGNLSYTGSSHDDFEPDRAAIKRLKQKLAGQKGGKFIPK